MWQKNHMISILGIGIYICSMLQLLHQIMVEYRFSRVFNGSNGDIDNTDQPI